MTDWSASSGVGAYWLLNAALVAASTTSVAPPHVNVSLSTLHPELLNVTHLEQKCLTHKKNAKIVALLLRKLSLKRIASWCSSTSN